MGGIKSFSNSCSRSSSRRNSSLTISDDNENLFRFFNKLHVYNDQSFLERRIVVF